VLLPYASYLRIYEPAEGGFAVDQGAGHGDPTATVATVTLSREQHAVLTRAFAPAAPPRVTDDLAGCYLMSSGGVQYVCPVDLALRCWLAIASFGEEADTVTGSLFLARDYLAFTEREYEVWREAHPAAVAHIRQATWGVPRTWFLLVAPEERELYDLEGQQSVRFRTPVAEAQRRLLSAFTVLNATIDDVDLLEELSDLGRWLAAFSDGCWLELDYAGVAYLLGAELVEDRSADEITTALRAIGRRDFATAGETYRQFVERWRVVTALERAS
jgi:hypothetical protein